MAWSSSALALPWITIGFTSISLLAPRTLSQLVHPLRRHSEFPECASPIRHPKRLPHLDPLRREYAAKNGQVLPALSVIVERVRILVFRRFRSCFQVLLREKSIRTSY